METIGEFEELGWGSVISKSSPRYGLERKTRYHGEVGVELPSHGIDKTSDPGSRASASDRHDSILLQRSHFQRHPKRIPGRAVLVMIRIYNPKEAAIFFFRKKDSRKVQPPC